MIVVMLCKPVFIALRVRYSVAISTQFFATFGHLCAACDEPRGNSACMVLKPHRHPRRNGVQKAGRMCEVGPPQAAVPPSRVLIRAGGAQRASCSARHRLPPEWRDADGKQNFHGSG